MLDLVGTKVTHLTPLEGLANLELLGLFHTKVSPARTSVLKKELPNCKIFGP